ILVRVVVDVAAVGGRRRDRAVVAGPLVVADVARRAARVRSAVPRARRRADPDLRAGRQGAHDELRAGETGVAVVTAAAVAVLLAEVTLDAAPLRGLTHEDSGRSERHAQIAAARPRTARRRPGADHAVDRGAVHRAGRSPAEAGVRLADGLPVRRAARAA